MIKYHRYQSDLSADQLAPAFYQLSQQSFVNGSPWTAEQLAVQLEQPTTCCWFASIDDRLVGFLLTQLIVDEVEILLLSVASDYWRQGIASGLLECLTNQLPNQSTAIFLEVRESNQVAQQFYQQVGFVKVGRRSAYYHRPTEDGLLLRFDLESELSDE